jgi:hypothetical protein
LFGKLQQRKETNHIRERGGEEKQKIKGIKKQSKKTEREREEEQKDTKRKIGRKTKRHS